MIITRLEVPGMITFAIPILILWFPIVNVYAMKIATQIIGNHETTGSEVLITNCNRSLLAEEFFKKNNVTCRAPPPPPF